SQTDTDVVLAHLAAEVGQHLVAAVELDVEVGIGQGVFDDPVHHNLVFGFFRHTLPFSCSRGPRHPYNDISPGDSHLMPKYVELNEDEAWAIDHTIRHTYAEGQSNVGRDLLLKVMTVVLEFEDRRGKPFAPELLPVALTAYECWAIDHQIRCDLTVKNKPL